MPRWVGSCVRTSECIADGRIRVVCIRISLNATVSLLLAATTQAGYATVLMTVAATVVAVAVAVTAAAAAAAT